VNRRRSSRPSTSGRMGSGRTFFFLNAPLRHLPHEARRPCSNVVASRRQGPRCPRAGPARSASRRRSRGLAARRSSARATPRHRAPATAVPPPPRAIRLASPAPAAAIAPVSSFAQGAAARRPSGRELAAAGRLLDAGSATAEPRNTFSLSVRPADLARCASLAESCSVQRGPLACDTTEVAGPPDRESGGRDPCTTDARAGSVRRDRAGPARSASSAPSAARRQGSGSRPGVGQEPASRPLPHRLPHRALIPPRRRARASEPVQSGQDTPSESAREGVTVLGAAPSIHPPAAPRAPCCKRREAARVAPSPATRAPACSRTSNPQLRG